MFYKICNKFIVDTGKKIKIRRQYQLTARPPRPGPCLDFGFQYALIRNNPDISKSNPVIDRYYL